MVIATQHGQAMLEGKRGDPGVFTGMGRPSFFSDARTGAYASVVGSVTVRISTLERF